MIAHVVIPEDRIKKLRHEKGWDVELGRFFDVSVAIAEDVVIEGEDVVQVLNVKEIYKAFGRGFDFSECMDLVDDEYLLLVINIKDFAGSGKRETVMKGRIIGEMGGMKKQIEKSAQVKVAVYGKTVSIIGRPENILVAEEAIKMILFGSKHNKVYRFLAEHKVV
ncbi:MAG: RNA-processing protein [Candidatus Aenigmarchaeota archaeon]|nr:RNA-processing protein [Candidatus Aenigmarchaeota archaeon]